MLQWDAMVLFWRFFGAVGRYLVTYCGSIGRCLEPSMIQQATVSYTHTHTHTHTTVLWPFFRDHLSELVP